MNKNNRFTNVELATIAVYKLGGESIPLDLEDIAMELFKMAPTRFSLKKYPDHIDIHVVRVSLSDAQRQNPPLLTGGIRNGYLLSPEGITWINSLGNLDTEAISGVGSYRKGSYLYSLEAEKKRLYKTEAYKLISSGEIDSLRIHHLHEFLRINEYFPKKKIISRLGIIENVTDKDEALNTVWITLKDMFSEEINEYES
jgi:hypothetical protein